MQYTDYTSGARNEYEPYSVTPVEMMGAPAAAQNVYERGSIAEALQIMFREADQRAAAGMMDGAPAMERPEATMSNVEAFQTLMETVQSKLKESDAVKHLKTTVEAGDEVSAHDVEAVFRAYDRALRDSFQRLRGELSPAQLHQLKYAATSELDWSFRDMVTQHLVASTDAETELRYSPQDFFLLLNPKARKIEYMSSGEILTTLKHSMAQTSTDQLKRDLAVVQHYHTVPAVSHAMADDNFPTNESLIN